VVISPLTRSRDSTRSAYESYNAQSNEDSIPRHRDLLCSGRRPSATARWSCNGRAPDIGI